MIKKLKESPEEIHGFKQCQNCLAVWDVLPESKKADNQLILLRCPICIDRVDTVIEVRRD